MALRYTYFVVEGSGEFPFDMLRYDQCFPVREAQDSYNMALDRANGLSPRRIMLMTLSESRRVTDGRWASFRWRVVGKSDDRFAMEQVAKQIPLYDHRR